MNTKLSSKIDDFVEKLSEKSRKIDFKFDSCTGITELWLRLNSPKGVLWHMRRG